MGRERGEDERAHRIPTPFALQNLGVPIVPTRNLRNPQQNYLPHGHLVLK